MGGRRKLRLVAGWVIGEVWPAMNALEILSPCPYLPVPERPISARDSRALGGDRGEVFYRLCLGYAQTKWLAGFPGQALLQLNRAMSADLKGDEGCLSEFPIPYSAVGWILRARPDRDGRFMGNPRRHWQHYASRMRGERSETRTWRAWACWAIAGCILPEGEFPCDDEQIRNERLRLPGLDEVGAGLDAFGLPGESDLWRGVLG